MLLLYILSRGTLSSPALQHTNIQRAIYELSLSLNQPACRRLQNKLRPLEFASLTPSNVIPRDLQICLHHAEKLPPLRVELVNFAVLLSRAADLRLMNYTAKT